MSKNGTFFTETDLLIRRPYLCQRAMHDGGGCARVLSPTQSASDINQSAAFSAISGGTVWPPSNSL